VDTLRNELVQVMKFLGALSSGMEESAGKDGAIVMANEAGKGLGKKHSQDAPKTDDILEAVAISKELLKKNHFLWELEPWKQDPKDDMVSTEINQYGQTVQKINLVFKDCMIRQTLFCYGHKQEQSLCYMMYGFFSGAVENIMGRQANLEILHAGPNACLKVLSVGEKICR